jgi:hypothetical protein
MKADSELDFEWSVATDGYEWVKFSPPFGRLVGKDWNRLILRPRSPATKRYRPLRECPNLSEEFAKLSEALLKRKSRALQDELRGFANRYGLLGIGSVFRRAGGEALTAPFDRDRGWENELWVMRVAAILGRLVRGRRQEQSAAHSWLREFIYWSEGDVNIRMHPILDEVIAFSDEVRALGWKPGDLIKPARHALRNQINQHLKEECAPHVEWKQDNSGLTLVHSPRTLLGAIWLQFAWRFSDRDPIAYISCRHCETQFVCSHNRTRGSRADAMFCSNRCRQASYRARKVQADTLH